MLALTGSAGDKAAISLIIVANIEPPTPTRPPPLPSFSGKWDFEPQPLTLEVQGDKVAGSYPFFNGQIEGRLSKDGRSATGTWKQSNGLEGRFELKMSSDGKQINGRRWSKTKGDIGDAWSGERLGKG